VKLHEYQAKEIMAKTGIPVPSSRTAMTPREARDVYNMLDSSIAVIKAQVHTGGRGKAGGIIAVHSPEEAEKAAGDILGKRLVTAQTGPEGVVVKKLLVETGLAVETEYYVGITIDREAGKPMLIASASGGMEIEEVAKKSPEKVVREHIEPVFGLQPFQARKIAFSLGVPGKLVEQFMDVLLKLHIVYLINDMELVEINPLVVSEAETLVALDAKMVIDDNGLFRHDELARLQDPTELDELEYRARQTGVNYIRLDGKVGCMVNGAGLAMATMDLVKHCGGEPANFLDVGGGASADKIKSALEILLSDERVEVVLVNIFGGILRCDVLAEGIIAAAKQMEIRMPVVIRLEGTNKEEGARILTESGLNFTVAHGMREAAELAVSMLKSDA